MSPEDIKNLVESNKIILFTKGTKDQPMCGFSNHTIEVFNQIGKPFECIDIFSDPSVRPAAPASAPPRMEEKFAVDGFPQSIRCERTWPTLPAQVQI